MMCLPWTLQEVKDKYNRDLVDEILSNLDGITPSQKSFLYNRLWAKYRGRMIGEYDYRKWLIYFQDQAELSWSWYKNVADVLNNPDLISQINNHVHEYTTDNGTTTNKNELLPDVPLAVGDEYLSDRNNVVGENIRESDIDTSTGRYLETTNKIINDLKEYTDVFTKEFEPLFLNRW